MVSASHFDTLLAPSPIPRAARLLAALLLAVGLMACQSKPDAGEQRTEDADGPPVVEITAADYAFAAPDTIPSGWVTFQMENRGEESHHFHLDRLPEGRTFAEWREKFHEPADSILHLLWEGKIDSTKALAALDQAIPDWAGLGDEGNVQTHGGVGLVAPGRTGQTTHRVEPGHYVMICVIRAPSGQLHLDLGMIHGLVATDSAVGRSPLSPDATVRGTGREIRMGDTLTSGRRTIGFRVEEVPEDFQGGTDGYYSVWLARLDDTTDMSEVAAWDGQNPAPYESLGGFEYLPPSDTAYVTADVEPGRYAWIWFYHGMDLLDGNDPMVKPFTVE